MKKNTRKFYLTLFSALCCTSLYAACKTFGSEKRVSLVLEGILTVVDLGETVKFDEYFDYSAVEEYTLTVTDENGQTQDLTGRSFWTPSDPGKYIFEFTVLSGEKKGADSFELTVSVPKLSWEYTLQNEIYDTGDTLVFADFFDAMNIAADSYYDWEMVMDSVTVSGETTEFSPQDTSYVFESDGEHIFAFHIQSEDGQRIGMTQAVRVRYVDKEMLEWMSRNDIEAYNALSLKKDGSVVLAEGIADYSGASVIPNSSKKIDSAYLAYNGNYTFNDFLVVDFTGNNMPTVTMFNEEVTNSFFYNDAATEAQNKGIVFSNGLTYGNGLPVVQWENSVNARYQVMGPWKTKRVDDTVEGWFRATASNSMGMTKLNTTPKARYRLIVGVTEGDSDSFTVAMFLASLDTGEILENAIEKISTSASATVNGEKNEWKCDIPGNYYSGSIALYGLFGKKTTLDKIYPIETDTDFDTVRDKYYTVSEFLPSAKTLVNIGQILNVSDYIAPYGGSAYMFAYSDEEGIRREITTETFSFDEAGVYTLQYNDGVNLNAELSVTVASIDERALEWLNNNNVSGYRIDGIDGERKVILQASVYGTDQSTPPVTMPCYSNACKGKADQSYVAFNGNYGLNDFLVFDFTGNNFPYISFFDKNVENHVFNNGATELIPKNEAIVISNGLTINTGEPFAAWSVTGSVNDRINVVGPYGALNFGDTHEYQYFRSTVADSRSNELALAKLAAVEKGQEKSYRVIIGFTAGTATEFTLSIYVTDLADGRVVLNKSHTVTSSVALSADYYSGNIALHGQFGKTTIIDKIYAIEEDTTLEALKAKYVVTAPLTIYNGTRTGDRVVLQASTYAGDNTPVLPTTAGRNPDMSYVAFNGKYGLNDFLVFDFTGDNLPYISFFNTNVTNSCLNLSTDRDSAAGGPYQDIDKTRKSWVIANGIRLKNGTDTGTIFGGETGAHASRLVLFGPYGIVNYDGGNADSSAGGPQWRQVIAGSTTDPSPIGMRQLLSATDPYRMIVGYTAGDNDSSVKLCIYVVNLNTKATVVDLAVIINHTDYEEGSIVLYSQFYNGGTTLDKIYPIEEDAAFDDLKNKFSV